jgi:hypothetical protein
MTTTVDTDVRPSPAVSGAVWAARVLFALYGAAAVAATVYFTFVAPVAEGGVATAGDWAVAAWSLRMGLGFLVVAVRIAADRTPVLALAVGLLVSHLAFGLVKRYGYGEEESAAFFVVDVVLLALVAGIAALRPRR